MDSTNVLTEGQGTTKPDAYSTRADGVKLPEYGTHCYTLLRSMQSGERLTVAKALNKFGVYALSQRCGELRRLGWPIQDRMIDTTGGARCKEYWLGERISDEMRDEYPLREASFR